jgi:hypothetical protein
MSKSAATSWRSLLLCFVLAFGAVIGVPMRPDEIARLMRWLSAPRIEMSLPDEADKGRRQH